jgi:hypothetical protein
VARPLVLVAVWRRAPIRLGCMLGGKLPLFAQDPPTEILDDAPKSVKHREHFAKPISQRGPFTEAERALAAAPHHQPRTRHPRPLVEPTLIPHLATHLPAPGLHHHTGRPHSPTLQRWTERQRTHWNTFHPTQQELLSAVGAGIAGRGGHGWAGCHDQWVDGLALGWRRRCRGQGLYAHRLWPVVGGDAG